MPPMGNKTKNAPQPTNPALNIEDSQVLTSKPTLLGQPPRGMDKAFAANPPGQLPEFACLPAPRKRCPISGCSRSFLLEHGEAGDFKIIRVRHPGKMRGKVLMHVPSLLAWLRRLAAEQTVVVVSAQPGEEDLRHGQP